MTKTEFLLNALNKGNKAGAYTIDEARAYHECLTQVKTDLDQYEELKGKIQEAQAAKAEAEAKAEAGFTDNYQPPKEKKIRVTAK